MRNSKCILSCQWAGTESLKLIGSALENELNKEVNVSVDDLSDLASYQVKDEIQVFDTEDATEPILGS